MIIMFGSTEELVLRGKSQRAIERYIKSEDLRNHPRLVSLTFTGPNGVLEELKR